MKPCVIGIVLATGIYMVLHNAFGTVSAINPDWRAIAITLLLGAAMFGYKHFTKKKLSPIALILIAAVLGMLLC